MDALNNVFELFFYQFCSIAKWIFAMRIAADIIRKGNESDIEGLIRSVVSGGLGYGCLYAIVNILNSVENAFIKG